MQSKVKFFEFEGESLPYTEKYVGKILHYVYFTYRGNSLVFKPCSYITIQAHKKAISLHEYHVLTSFLSYMYGVD